MFAASIEWMQAAVAALRAAPVTAGCAVFDGPVADYSPVAGLDLVIVGWDDEDETVTSLSWEGGWRDTGQAAIHSGQVVVPVTIVSQSGPDMTPTERLAAAEALITAVIGVLIPSPRDSALGVANVMWAQNSAATLQQVPTEGGPIVRAVVRITLAVLA